MPETKSRHLHFIVRSEKDQYSYNPGYGHFLNSNLQALNTQKPDGAKELLTAAATLMFAPKEPIADSIWDLTEIPKRDPKPLKESLPRVFAGLVDESTIISPEPNNPAFGGIPNPMFGPVSELDYGFPTSSMIKISNDKGKDLGLVNLDFQVSRLLRHIATLNADDQQKACKIVSTLLRVPLTPDTLADAQDRIVGAIEVIYNQHDDDGFGPRVKRAVRWEEKWTYFKHDIRRAEVGQEQEPNPLATYESPKAIIHGDALITPVYTNRGSGYQAYRGYFDALCKNQNLDPENIPEDYIIQFKHEVPGSNEKLKLMSIGTRAALKDEFTRRHSSEYPELVKDFKTASFALEYSFHARDELTDDRDEPFIGKKKEYPKIFDRELVMLHPNCDGHFMENLAKCIDPLLEKIDSEKTDKDTKINAMAEAYWLVAQSTPVWRGGSAYARVILEHLSQRIRDKGIDYEIPYTKPEIDLWAEAATSDVSAFKFRFRMGQFFDTQYTDKQMEDYAMAHMNKSLKRTFDRPTGTSIAGQGAG